METGFDLFKAIGEETRDHFLPKPKMDLEGFQLGAASAMYMAALNLKALLMLKGPDEKLILTQVVAMALTGHSERSTLPSVLAARGVPRPERDVLGRWSADGSDDYVRNYKAVVKRLIGVVVGDVKAGKVFDNLDEDSAFDELQDVMIRKGVSEEMAREEVSKVKDVGKEWLKSEAVMKITGEEVEALVADIKPKEELKKAMREEIQKAQAIDEEEGIEEGEFLVAVTRDRGSCLHLAKGCWRARGRRFGSWEILPGTPRMDQWTRFCRDCWPSPTNLGQGATPDSLAKEVSDSASADSSSE